MWQLQILPQVKLRCFTGWFKTKMKQIPKCIKEAKSTHSHAAQPGGRAQPEARRRPGKAGKIPPESSKVSLTGTTCSDFFVN